MCSADCSVSMEDLADVPLTVRARSGVILQDTDAVPPVNYIEVVHQYSYGSG